MNAIIDKQKGVSLIITFFVMIIILAVVLSISTLLYSEVKVIRNIGNSIVSFYAADSGVEKILYYDRQVLPIISTTNYCDENTPCTILTQTCDLTNKVCTYTAPRGLCSIYPFDTALDTALDTGACRRSTDGILGNSSIFCDPNNDSNGNFLTPVAGTTDPIHGCDFGVCDDCQISFSTTLDNGASYYATAKVSPSGDPGFSKNSDFQIESRGSYGDTGRQIKISISSAQSEGAIQIANACANPKTTNDSTTINILADVKATITGTDTIASVAASIYDAQGNYYGADGNLATVCASDIQCNLSTEKCVHGLCAPFLNLVPGSGDYSCGTWSYTWATNSTNRAGKYYVDLDVLDSLQNPNEQTLPKILPCGFEQTTQLCTP